MATFQILQQFHILSFESKTSTYEFYSALVRLSDNTGTQKPWVCGKANASQPVMYLSFTGLLRGVRAYDL